MASELVSDVSDTRFGAGIGFLISVLEKLNTFRLTCLITLVLLMWKWMGVFLKKNHIFRCWTIFFFEIRLGLLHCSISKTASKKIGAQIPPVKFPFSEVALYPSKSGIPACMEYCFHVWLVLVTATWIY